MCDFPLRRLCDAGVVLLDCEHATPKPTECSEYVYVAIPDLKDGRIDLANARRITHEDFRQWTRKTKPQADDIIMTRRGRVGDIAVVPEGLKCAIGQNLVILRSDGSEVDQSYLRWALRGSRYETEVRKYLNVGAVFDSLNCRDIPLFEIPVPPIEKQRGIAHILGTLDDKIELNRRMNRTLEAIARAIFKSWFIDFDPVIDNALASGKPIPEELRKRAGIRAGQNQPSPPPSPNGRGWREARCDGPYGASSFPSGRGGGEGVADQFPSTLGRGARGKGASEAPHSSSPFGRGGGEGVASYRDLFPDSFQDSSLGKIPEGWEVGTLGGLCEKPQYGYTESAKEEPAGPRFLRIKDINKQPWIEWEAVPYCEIDQASYEKYKLVSGDIVVARIADPGHAAYIEENVKAVFASYLIRFRPTDPRYGRYIQYWQRTLAYWELVRGRRSGSTRGNLNARVLREFPLLIPPVQVAERFAESAGPLRILVQHNLDESFVLAQARDTLLPALLGGQLLARFDRQQRRGDE